MSEQTENSRLQLFIVMGVSGSGKSEIAQQLASELSHEARIEFLDADDFHTAEAKQRMAANLPLDDTMRKPWIAAIVNKLNELSDQKTNVVLAYSGLKQQHRKCFTVLDYQCHFYYLAASIDVIRQRLQQRKEHFFNVNLLESQFAAMEEITEEEQAYVTKVDASTSFKEVYQSVLALAKASFKQELL